MSERKLIYLVLLAVVLVFTLAPTASAQLTSNAQAIALQANKPESLTVSVPSVATVTFALNGGTANGSATPSWTTTWVLGNARNNVKVCAYLAGAMTGASVGNTDTIPVANILGQPGAAGAFTAFTGAACGQGNALQISDTNITGVNKQGSKNDSVALQINETGLTLWADTYNGTLNIIAQATP